MLIYALLVLDISPELKDNIFNALYSYGPQQTWAEPYHLYSTGDCTWPPIASIGICTSCDDTTALVQKSCRSDSTTSDSVNCTLSLSVNYTEIRILLPSLSYVYEKGRDAAYGKDYVSEPTLKASLCTISPYIQSIQFTYKQSDQI
jgi:hypothetical protein